MKVLPIEFMGRGEVKGIFFKQLFRHQNICIYYRSDGLYESVRIRFRNQASWKINDIIINYEEKEYYPKSNEWGHFETCDHSLTRIVEYFNRLCYSTGSEFRIDIENLPFSDPKNRKTVKA